MFREPGGYYIIGDFAHRGSNSAGMEADRHPPATAKVLPLRAVTPGLVRRRWSHMGRVAA